MGGITADSAEINKWDDMFLPEPICGNFALAADKEETAPTREQ